MKVLLINGSPRINGNTSIALKEVASILNGNGIETKFFDIGNLPIRGCIDCSKCLENNKCVFNDIVNEIADEFKDADGLIIGSPVYYAGANGTLINFLTRLFHSARFDKTMKVGASVAVGRRGGLSTTYDELNKFFGVSGMPVVSSQYWNSVHGKDEGDAFADEEGLQTMRTLGRNMAFLIKSINLGKEAFGLPTKEKPIRSNFVH